ncbi:N-terminal phage integrase SAM-like domain-containing protein [Streptodolium elevatio]
MSPHREDIAPTSAEGFADEPAARAALRRLIDGEAGGFDADPNRTLPEYLEAWLAEKQLTLKPTTYARYRDYVNNDLIPALGTLRLDDLGDRQILALLVAEYSTRTGCGPGVVRASSPASLIRRRASMYPSPVAC